MDIDDAGVRKIAALARLALSDEELALQREGLQRILAYVKRLDELDTRDVLPTSHVLDMHQPFRPDEVGPTLSTEEALANAPRSDGESFVVPQVIQGAS
jgi:aspartyl-tRNA(Asn)/glutamyl-tRNA(Gln) amidotransferase subunit C